MNIEHKVVLNKPASFQDLLDADTREVPEIRRRRGDQDVGPLEVPTSWYLDRSIHEQEIENIWKKTWQMACRVDDLANAGDTWIYRVANISILLVRDNDNVIRGFYNSCLHRGRTLRECPGNVSIIQCPFHGFAWSLKGRLQMVPARDQFPQIDAEEFRLPEVKVGQWGGFVFINPDLNAASLESFLGDLPEHFKMWPLDKRVKVAHVEKSFKCNWKLAQDAFLEAFHVNTTHPQMMIYLGEQVHQYDSFGAFARGQLGGLVASQGYVGEKTPQNIFDGLMGLWAGQDSEIKISEDVPLRVTVADMNRQRARPILGNAVDQCSDTEMVDLTWYSVFPNFVPFMGFAPPLIYSFRPDGDDHTRSIFELMILAPFPEGAETPPPAKLRVLGDDEDFMVATELGGMSPVLNQDTATLDHLTLGLMNNKRGKLVFAQHHELMLRHFYAKWQEAMNLTAE